MLHRVFQYAQAHTRTRARIGAMPGPAQWQHIAAARDVDAMVQRMRDHGLAHWVAPLPRSPDARAIEQSLQQGVVVLVDDVCRWLPRRWHNVAQWLRSGLYQVLIPAMLSDPGYQPPQGLPVTLRRIAAQPLDSRRDALLSAGYARYLRQDPAESLDIWWRDFEAVCPRLHGAEAHAVRRTERLLRHHLATLRSSRLQARSAEPSGVLQWRLREQLHQHLRALLGYESFHAGLLLIYALLELLQFERCRALLLARVHDWDAAGVV